MSPNLRERRVTGCLTMRRVLPLHRGNVLIKILIVSNVDSELLKSRSEVTKSYIVGMYREKDALGVETGVLRIWNDDAW